MVTLVWMDDSMTGIEEEVARYYERFRSKFEQWWAADKTLGIHFGYYDKGVTSHVQSIFAMNDFTWSLLQIPPGASATILDVGCGVGGTSIYLARKHPQASFTGIDIVPTQINLAIRFAEQWGVSANTKFIVGSYLRTGFPGNYFDGVLALESINYAQDINTFIQEMYRVLKPGCRLVILDGFRNNKPVNPVLRKLHKMWLDGNALTDVESLEHLTFCLKNQGFHDITVTDISEHVKPSALRLSIISIPFFFAAVLKILVTLNRLNKAEDYYYFMGVPLLGSFVAVGGLSSYYAVTAIK